MANHKTIGILGGMGPEATMELFKRIIENTPAQTDQEHIKVFISNDPSIPDRTAYIDGNGDSPLPKLKENLIKLADAGSDAILIPCMTAHSFINELKNFSPVPVINGIKLVDFYLKKHTHLERVALFATQGSYKTKVFQKNISSTLLVPTKDSQNQIMNVIYGEDGIKSGNTSDELLEKLIAELEKLGKLDAVIAGCTELGLIMNSNKLELEVIDPLTLMAEHAVKIAYNEKIVN